MCVFRYKYMSKTDNTNPYIKCEVRTNQYDCSTQRNYNHKVHNWENSLNIT